MARSLLVEKSISNKIKASILSAIYIVIGMCFFIGRASALDIEVIGNVSKGTCEVSYESMTVKFDKPLLTPQIKPNVDDETYVKPFSLKYSCTDFNLSDGPAPFKMKITPGIGTLVDNSNKIYPTNNITGAAFVLKNCDENKLNCKVVNLNAGGEISFDVTANSQLENHFEVNVVQLGTTQPIPGELVASVDIVLLQP